jgi:hypothetical protein
MVAKKDLRRKLARALARKAREEFGNGARVRVKKGDCRDYLHVYVTSRKFAGMGFHRRGALVWKWMEGLVAPEERAKVTYLLGLTPAEERDFLISSP